MRFLRVTSLVFALTTAAHFEKVAALPKEVRHALGVPDARAEVQDAVLRVFRQVDDVLEDRNPASRLIGSYLQGTVDSFEVVRRRLIGFSIEGILIGDVGLDGLKSRFRQNPSTLQYFSRRIAEGLNRFDQSRSHPSLRLGQRSRKGRWIGRRIRPVALFAWPRS